jgi:thioredoxin 1
MNAKMLLLTLTAALLPPGSFAFAEAAAEDVPPTVQSVYPTLTSGALSLAVLKDLPEGILLKAGELEITSESIAGIITAQPEQTREDFEKNAFFILEQEATGAILTDLARKASPASGPETAPQDENVLLERFFEKEVFKTIEATDDEVKIFYEANKDMFGGATQGQVGASIKTYLISQKKQEKASNYIQTLGRQTPIHVSSAWVKKQAALAYDNPVDKARQSQRPSLVDFGASGCKPCDMMTPILDALGKKYAGKLNVVFVHVREHQILASRYGIQSIPVQVFYDKDGKEVFRHTGFFAQDEIEKKLKEIEVP